jgi:RHS repeat-associated protein
MHTPSPTTHLPVCVFASLFTGKERDTESGLDYFGARYYSSNMGRWMSPDWADKPEAVPYSDLMNPQSLNLYGYVNNNPLSRADADGHDFWDKLVNAVHGNGFHDTPKPPAPAAPKPPIPQRPGHTDGVAGAAPTTIQPGTKYQNPKDAAVTTLKNINPTSIREDREYSARAVQNADGSYSVVGPQPIGQAGGGLPDVPAGAANAAEIHTHGGNDPGYDNEHFSGVDRQTSTREGVPSYLATPAGSIQVFNPATQQTTVIQQPQ